MACQTLDTAELERLVIAFMETQGMCLLATCSDNVPRASAVEFFPVGTTLYVLTEGGRKIENIERNRRVSVAIHTPFTGWDDIKGVQMTGTAEIGGKGSVIFTEGEHAYAARRKTPVQLPGFMNVIRITPQRIEYLDMTLRARGCAVRQVLEYPPSPGSCFSG